MKNKPTINEMIAVMTAHSNGEIIEFFNKVYPSDNGWQEVSNPSWNWSEISYRVKSVELGPDQINWDHVHSDYNFMARDKDGSVRLFKNKPDISPYNDLWVPSQEGENYVDAISHSSYVRGNYNFRDSLVTRPSSS